MKSDKDIFFSVLKCEFISLKLNNQYEKIKSANLKVLKFKF